MDKDISEISGVGEKTAEKLKSAGYKDITRLAKTNAGRLSEAADIGEGRAQSIISAARDAYSGGSRFVSGDEVKKQQQGLEKITTGSEQFDGILGGGVPTNYLTEAYGEFGTAKTQLSHQLSVNVQLPEDEGGLEKRAIFIDTEDTFVAERIEQMAEGVGIGPEEALKNIDVAKVHDTDDQIDVVEQIKNRDLSDVGLIVIDSLTAHFRAEFQGRSEYGERSNKMADHLTELRRLASHGIAVFYTNQVGSDPGEQFGDPTYAYGGNVLAHNSSFRLYMQDRQSKGWAARLVDSPHLPQQEARFDVTEGGIVDAD